MKIKEDNDKRLVNNSFTEGTVVFDRDLHIITKNNKLIARFEKIKVIDLRAYSNNDYRT